MSTTAVANLVVKVIEWIKERATRDRELESMSHTELQLLAADIGISEAELLAITPGISEHGDLLDEMIRAHGLDPELVRHIFVGAVREMEAVCARCRDAEVCRRELKAGTAAQRSRAFCGNADVIDELMGIDV
jgi:uncharacterized protein YjiS (DUF1127 family)